ncbi:MAG: LLM class flavin-dependent oxidoreductase [Candidatus Caldarchaeum sp.]
MAGKIWVGVNVNTRATLIVPEYTFKKLLELAALVDELGFDSVWVGDSFAARPRLDPLTTLAAIAVKTSKVRLGTACLNFPWRNALLFAQQWATLDLLSGGRTVLGLGTGLGSRKTPIEKEYEMLGIPFKDRVERLEEGVYVLKKLWTENNVSYRGRFYAFEDLTLEPKPLQKPHPPIYLVAWPFKWRDVDNLYPVDARLSRRMMERVAKIGDGWMVDGGTTPASWRKCYEELAEAASKYGRDLEQITTCIQFTGTISNEREKAQSEGRIFLSEYYYAEKYDPISFFHCFGTPDDWIKSIDEYIEAGMRGFILRFAAKDQFGQVKIFSDHVMPSL